MSEIEKPQVELRLPFSVWSWQVAVRVIPPPFAAVLLGHFCGTGLINGLLPIATLGAFITLAISGCCPWKDGRFSDLLFAAYAEGLILCEPIQFIGDYRAVIVAVILVLPVLVGHVVALRKKFWLLAIGTWLLLIAAMGALTFNVRHWDKGMGFYSMWLS